MRFCLLLSVVRRGEGGQKGLELVTDGMMRYNDW